MVDTSLEIKCNKCGFKFWYSGDGEYPSMTECPKCQNRTKIPEEG